MVRGHHGPDRHTDFYPGRRIGVCPDDTEQSGRGLVLIRPAGVTNRGEYRFTDLSVIQQNIKAAKTERAERNYDEAEQAGP